jgi:hypothetical protein
MDERRGSPHDFKRIENEVEKAVFHRFGVSLPLPVEVKQADLRVLAAEQRQIMPKGTDVWIRGQQVVPADVVVRHLTPREAKRLFLARFEALKPTHLLAKPAANYEFADHCQRRVGCIRDHCITARGKAFEANEMGW